MIFDWIAMQTAVAGVFSEATGIAFMWDQSKRLPRLPIGVLSLGDSRSIGRDGHHYVISDSDIELQLHGYRELTISVQIHVKNTKSGPSARVLAEQARLALASPNHRKLLRRVGLVFVESHPLVSIDLGRMSGCELRSVFDVVFRIVLHDRIMAEPNSFFESVEVGGSVL